MTEGPSIQEIHACFYENRMLDVTFVKLNDSNRQLHPTYEFKGLRKLKESTVVCIVIITVEPIVDLVDFN